MSTARRGGVDDIILLSGGAGDPKVLAGTVDPSAGAGVPAPEGSTFLRYTAAAGQSWLKTGAADTAWTMLAVATGDISALSERWTQQNVKVSLAAVVMSAMVSTSFDVSKAIRAGSIRGISTNLTTPVTSVTAGSLIVEATINGAVGLSVSHSSGTNPSGGQSTQAAGVDTFVAGDLIGMKITTIAGLTPANMIDIEAYLDVSY